jgi:Uncharacterized protein conserved in bacteria
MSTLQNLVTACQADDAQLREQAQTRTDNWQPWLAPVSVASPTGEDPGYDDDFQRIREEVNKLSGIDTELICTLAEKLLTTTAKDIRIATYYCWARLHQDGEAGFAEGLELLAGLLQRYGMQLHPQRDRSRKAALEWLAGSRVLDSLSLFPGGHPRGCTAYSRGLAAHQYPSGDRAGSITARAECPVQRAGVSPDEGRWCGCRGTAERRE